MQLLQIKFYETSFIRLLSISKDRDPTTSLGLCSSVTTLITKNKQTDKPKKPTFILFIIIF